MMVSTGISRPGAIMNMDRHENVVSIVTFSTGKTYTLHNINNDLFCTNIFEDQAQWRGATYWLDGQQD